MTVKELIELLQQEPLDYEVYVDSPDLKQDFFVDGISVCPSKKQLHIQTAE
jgi:hypothetical protein